MRILLVEDDSMIGEAVLKGLQQEGLTVDWTLSGEDALLAFAVEPYELVVLDLGLPGISGLDDPQFPLHIFEFMLSYTKQVFGVPLVLPEKSVPSVKVSATGFLEWR